MREFEGVNDIHVLTSKTNKAIRYTIKVENLSKTPRNFIDVLSGAKSLEDITKKTEEKEIVIEDTEEKDYNLEVSYLLYLDNKNKEERNNIPEPEEEEER